MSPTNVDDDVLRILPEVGGEGGHDPTPEVAQESAVAIVAMRIDDDEAVPLVLNPTSAVPSPGNGLDAAVASIVAVTMTKRIEGQNTLKIRSNHHLPKAPPIQKELHHPPPGRHPPNRVERVGGTSRTAMAKKRSAGMVVPSANPRDGDTIDPKVGAENDDETVARRTNPLVEARKTTLAARVGPPAESTAVPVPKTTSQTHLHDEAVENIIDERVNGSDGLMPPQVREVEKLAENERRKQAESLLDGSDARGVRPNPREPRVSHSPRRPPRKRIVAVYLSILAEIQVRTVRLPTRLCKHTHTQDINIPS